MKSLYLQPTTEQEIVEMCPSSLVETAAGYDQITMNVIKEIIDLQGVPKVRSSNL